jgi:hypothetical protein
VFLLKVHVKHAIKENRRYKVYLDGKELDRCVYADDENGIVLVIDWETINLVFESLTDGTGYFNYTVDEELANLLGHCNYYKALKGEVRIEPMTD